VAAGHFCWAKISDLTLLLNHSLFIEQVLGPRSVGFAVSNFVGFLVLCSSQTSTDTASVGSTRYSARLLVVLHPPC